VDEVGIGDGVRSRIREILGQRVSKGVRSRSSGDARVIGYNAGKAARDSEQYENRKAEDLFTIRERLEAGEVSIPNHALLISQWCSYRWESSTKGRTRIVDPDDSPDFGDCAIMLYSGMDRRPAVKGKRVKWIQ
jgi:hypothetical protein